ncbi:MAG: GIY-YIG nuclease family protein [Ekhidna sp.]
MRHLCFGELPASVVEPACGRQVGRREKLKTERVFFVYAIKSTSRNYIYVDLTNNLERRLSEHNEGRNRTTKPYRPFVLIHLEKFETRMEARNREKYLKSGIGKDFLKSL